MPSKFQCNEEQSEISYFAFSGLGNNSLSRESTDPLLVHDKRQVEKAGEI